jgi:hypothetical protein
VGEFASEVEVLAVGLRQCVPQSLYFFSVLLLQVCDLAGQSENEGAFGVDGGGWCGNGSSLGSQAFDAFAQVGVVIEEGVRDACLALNAPRPTWSSRWSPSVTRRARSS